MEPLPLPVVRVRVDDVETLAVVSTGAELTILDPSVRAAPGVIDALRLGAIEVCDVPHTTRSLDPLSEALGARVGAAIGLDLLLRLQARIDGPGGRLTLSAAAAAPSPDAARAPFVTPTGSFLAVVARIAGEPAWLTVDTTAIFPLALTAGADEALGLDGLAWEPARGPGQAIAPVAIGALAIEALPLARGILDDDHARAVGAPVAGAIGWGLLAELVTVLDPDARALRFE
ncbi:MAG: hypothetical protein KF729_25295 [Sandaracinaceae bacterium]|nr:hypothetical protein [Sandaracinaceae bacterium]